MIASGHTGTWVAKEINRNRNTIAHWVHLFNERGVDGLIPDFKGNPGKILSEEELNELKEAVRKPPRQSGFKRGRWSGKLIALYIKRAFKKEVSYRTALRYIENLGFRRKLPRKRLKKADPEEQREFAQGLTILESSRSPRSQTVWMDQGQIWCDALLRWIWCLRGEEALVDSTSPSKEDKICFYVAVARPMGLVITSIVESFNRTATAEFLDKIRAKLPGWRLDLVWDGASYHKGEVVKEALDRNSIHLHPLPSYSPAMNAAEYWIRWAKEDISYNYCWDGRGALVQSFEDFSASMSQRPEEVLRRCVPDLLGFRCQ